MASSTIQNERTIAFEKLKPICVETSQLALQYQTKKISGRRVTQTVQRLLQTLQDVTSQTVKLDQKLADYVFFPLSYLFRQSSLLPAQANELSLNCLQILISGGWCLHGGAELCKQIVILLGFLVGGKSVDAKSCDVNEEVSVAALHCFIALFETSKDSIILSGKGLDVLDTLTLGHILTVILDALLAGSSSKVHIAAITALKGLIYCIQDRSALRKFLPGIVSNLTKVLQPTTQSPRSYKMLECALNTMNLLLHRTMAIRQSPLASRSVSSKELQKITSEEIQSEEAWVKATSPQIKLAITKVVRLRYHERTEVVEALIEICTTVLRECRETLANTASLALETLISICGQAEIGTGTEKTQLVQSLLALDTSLVEMLRVATYEWVSTLPRVIQSNDAITHGHHIRQISAAYQAIAYVGDDMDMLDLALGSYLCESVTTAISVSKSAKVGLMSNEAPTNSTMIEISRGFASANKFCYVALVDSSKKGALEELKNLLRDLDSIRTSSPLRQRLTALLVASTGRDQLGCLWLCSTLMSSALSSSTDVNLLPDYQSNLSHENEQFCEVVYSYCLSILSRPAAENGSDSQLQAMALEVLAFRSCQQRQEYRPELIDALYPVVERIGSSNAMLREHAMTALDTIALACNYTSSSDLIIQNVDYLVNFIALKFNTCEISPRDSQVLFIMVKLCGRTLIPYLDDLIESVFSTLASYHGYPRLVESLFLVLSAVVEEASKVNLPLACYAIKTHPRKGWLPPATVSETVDVLKQLQLRAGLAIQPMDLAELDGVSRNPNRGDSKHPADSLDPQPQAPSKIGSTIQNILRTGQHYLTHDSPNIRRQILRLTTLGCSILYHSEDEFLPVINDLWPVIMKRLYDSEPFVSITASETISNIFKYAGDFVASRVETEWHDICNLYKRVHRRMLQENRGKGGRGDFTATHQMWEALLNMFCTLIDWVRIGVEVEDDLLDMLGPYAQSRPDIRDALNALNSDAVWLRLEAERQRDTAGDALSLPFLEGFNFKRITVL